MILNQILIRYLLSVDRISFLLYRLNYNELSETLIVDIDLA